MSSRDLMRRREKIRGDIDESCCRLQDGENETGRVIEVLHNTREILDDLDREFERQTGLTGKDIAFLFVATALQCTRIFLVNNLTRIEKAGKGNRNEDTLHELQEKVLNRFSNGAKSMPQKYYAPLNQIVTGRGVPYDATRYQSENYKLFQGANHRFATLGHDPVLGLIFGTANILTNTITCVNTPIITTNHVVYDAEMKNPQISSYASTAITLKRAGERINGDMASVVAAVIKQVIHIGTDMYTPCGIQLPEANLVLSKSEAEKLTRYISTGDLLKIGTSAELAVTINAIISILHQLTFDGGRELSRDLYSVRTRKIILYSNVIASSSNVIWVGTNLAIGNEAAIKELDIGGLLVTVHRLMTDTQYIKQIKEEFIFGNYRQLIQGNDF